MARPAWSSRAAARVALATAALIAAIALLPARPAVGGAGSFTTVVSDHVFSQLRLDPTNTRVAYAAGNDSSGNSYVYKSFDGGNTWAATNSGLGLMDVFAMAIARSNSQVVYVGGYNPTAQSAELFMTPNGGASWSQVAPSLGNVSIQAIAIDPTTEKTVYLGTNHGIYKTSDGFANVAVLAGMGVRNVHALVIDHTNAATLYAGTDPGTDPGVWKSADGGGTWALANTGLSSGAGIFVLEINPSATQTIYAGVGSAPYSIAKTTNGAQSWTQLASTDPIYTIAVDPLNGNNVYYSTSNGLYRSGDAGTSFDLIDNHGGGPVEVDPNSPQTIYLGGQGITTYTTSPPILATPTPSGPTATPGGPTPTPTPTPTPSTTTTPSATGTAAVTPAATTTACALLPTPPGSGQSFTFPQTGHTVSGIWLDYLKSHGDVDNLGYPRTDVICDPLTGQTVQYFQRVVLEYHPEQQPAYQIQRRLLVDAIYPNPPDPPVPASNPPPGDVFYFPLGPNGFGHFVANFTATGAATYFKQYFDTHGKEDTFGYPKEEPKQRTGADGVVRWTQRFQAAVFEYHPENDRSGVNANGVPWRNYRVQLELVGDEYIAKYNLGFK